MRALSARAALVALTTAPFLLLALPAGAAGKGGRVTYVTANTAYLDVGAADGLAAGTVLELSRRKGKPGSCEVTVVAAHQAACKSDRAAVGDRFTLKTPPAAAEAVVAARDALPDPAVVATRRQALDGAPAPRVSYQKPRRALGPAWGTRGYVGVKQQAWATLGKDDATTTRTVLSGGARVDLGFLSGLAATGAVRLVADELQPASTRFRPQDPAELYLWEAALVLDDGRGPLVARAGRFLPRKAPGATTLDGAQASLRLLGGSLEVGAYGGTVPDLITLMPSLDRLTGGVTLAFDTPLGKDLLLLPRARVALVSSPDFQAMRAETEAQTQLLWGSFLAAGASVRAGLDARSAAPSFDAARVDLELRPDASLRMGGGYRYLAPLAQDFDAGSAVPEALGAHHGQGSLSWSTTEWLVVGAQGGLAADVEWGMVRGWAGPELRLPRLFGELGGIGVGYAEELGAFAGRNGWAQVDFSPFSVLTLWSRAAYFESEGAGEDPLREGALFAGLEAPLLPWLSLRARAHGLMPLPAFDGGPRATPTILAADGGLVVSW